MASKSSQHEPEKGEIIEEALDAVESVIDRVKALYEQYFLGMQKQPPSHLHTDVERKLRDLAQLQIRNTALRYRFVTLQQKFGSYNAYWRRTLRQIENGTYVRALSKLTRQAARTGAEIPEEILAAMPKRMREQVRRDREAALAAARRRGGHVDEAELLTLAPLESEEAPASQPQVSRAPLAGRDARGAFFLDDAESLDVEALFAAAIGDDPEPPAPPPSPPPATPATPAPLRAAGLGSGLATPRPTPPRPSTPPARGAPIAPTQRPAATAPATPPARAVVPSTQPTATKPSPRTIPAIPAIPTIPTSPTPRMKESTAPSQITRPNPIVAGASSNQPSVPVKSMEGPFARTPAPRPSSTSPAAARPPPGMTDADVNALYAKYVKAKEAVGETAEPGAYGKLLKTINAQAPKIMKQYNAKAVDFSVVVKDNQVVIRAKPKT